MNEEVRNEEDRLKEELKNVGIMIRWRREEYLKLVQETDKCWNSLQIMERGERDIKRRLEECLSRKEAVKDKEKERVEIE